MTLGLRRVASALALALAATPAIADTVTITYMYDAAGRVVAALYSNGVCITYAYDRTGNRTEKRVLTSAPANPPLWGSETYGCFRWSP